MSNQEISPKTSNHPLTILFISFVVLSVIGYVLRGTSSAPASHAVESAGVIVGLASGFVLFVWIVLVIVHLIKKL